MPARILKALLDREPPDSGATAMNLPLWVTLAALAVGGVATADQSSSRVNETARQLAEFRARVDQYVEVRKKAARQSPPLEETADPAKIKAAQQALAERIRALRADARPGDIFTPGVRPVFRRLLAPQLKGETGRDTKAVIKEDSPPSVPLRVNAKYPEKAALPTVPPNILTTLPPLPKEVEYRLVNKDLLLLDPDAELIVDYIPNAIR
jgi:hypothetical protein